MLSDIFVIGNSTIKLGAIASTNDYMRELLTKGEKITEGTVVIAENQHGGKGQRGNKWVSEPGANLTFSIVLYPKFLRPSDQFELSKAISLGIISYLADTLPVNLSEIKVKWPNDIYVGSEKVCGILIENLVSGNRLTHSIVGIGLNVNQKIFDKSLSNPSSMKLLSETEYDLSLTLNGLCHCLDRRYIDLRNNSTQRINKEYLSALYKFEEIWDYEIKGVPVRAQIVGVSETGALIMEDEHGKQVHCNFKEVVFS